MKRIDELVDTGGSAFPFANDSNKEYYWINHGMTLRDYFATAAMQGFIAEGNTSGAHYPIEMIAKGSYEMADAMLKARKE